MIELVSNLPPYHPTTLPSYRHEPVMIKEALEHLALSPGDAVLDATLGGGGYSSAIAAAVGPNGLVIGVDQDPLAINAVTARAEQEKLTNLRIIHDTFDHIESIAQNVLPSGHAGFAGVVFDLGLSSAQLEDESRGFSFQLDAPLDMSMGGEDARSTYAIVNRYQTEELTKILRDYGEEKFAGRIASAIVSARKRQPIERTAQLVEIIKSAVPGVYIRGRLHFATRTFQALRIATNRELDRLPIALAQALNILKPGGTLVVVSYHSLEDRIVKRFFRQEASGCICSSEQPTCTCDHQPRLKIVTKRPVTPAAVELNSNPRSRSAKLRAATKL